MNSKLVVSLMRVYKKYFSLILIFLFGKGCRYFPTCSEYAVEAFKKYSFSKASALVVGRIISCHPFGKGGYDPVP